MTNLEYSRIVEELQPLVDRHFTKISLAGSAYRMKIGSTSIICEPGVRLHITKYIDKETTLDSFCQKVRKELDNSRLTAVSQVNNDRVILLDFRAGSLYFEMFGKGNIILVQDGKTVSAVKREKWADREIRPGAAYQPPKPSVITELGKALSGKYVAASLMKLPLGKPYVHEILLRARIDEKAPGDKLTKQQVAGLEKELESLKGSLEPLCFYEGDAPVDFSLARLTAYAGARAESLPSLSEAADEYYFRKKAPENPELAKLALRLGKQEERLEKLKAEELEKKGKGDFIYERFQEIEKILETASKAGLEDVEKELAGYKAKINKKEKQWKSSFSSPFPARQGNSSGACSPSSACQRPRKGRSCPLPSRAYGHCRCLSHLPRACQ
uniref:NFACT RNA-binding domain-containing protein n=1 Tax=Candidatus Methanophaga sp. ANME-1 ERB7 TaxID=2759913 RepID=A0A7G9Z2E8_9EURY|nr:hypothetical protein IPKNHHKO_00006 [Methanosarcinales archaeon ANME-1 ERB7]